MEKPQTYEEYLAHFPECLSINIYELTEIKDISALGLYVYLKYLEEKNPKIMILEENEISENFNCSKKKIRRLFDYLVKAGFQV